jgi:hypothetical protein
MATLPNLFGLRNEARLRYLDAEYHVISSGDFVRCAVTGAVIPLGDLKYWSVERQEAYKDAAASLARHLEVSDARRARTSA